MRAVIQRVRHAQVEVEGVVVGSIERGILALLGVGAEDSKEDASYLATKIVHLRIFEDEQGKMNRSLLDIGGALLAISQFTLYGDCRKGRRPSFTKAMEPNKAAFLLEHFLAETRQYTISVQTGQFGASMEVFLCNDGPVTLILESQHE